LRELPRVQRIRLLNRNNFTLRISELPYISRQDTNVETNRLIWKHTEVGQRINKAAETTWTTKTLPCFHMQALPIAKLQIAVFSWLHWRSGPTASLQTTQEQPTEGFHATDSDKHCN
jgi:hypothetical protein